MRSGFVKCMPISWVKLMPNSHANEFLSRALTFIDILAAYEDVDDLKERTMAGMDITDELYERLCVHDEMAGEAFVDHCDDYCVEVRGE